MENVFDKLFENKIPFAVCLAHVKPKVTDVEASACDYYILLYKKDRHKMKGYRFISSSEISYKTCEYDMSYKDIKIFKENIDKFKKAIHGESGLVYELRENPFSEYYNESIKNYKNSNK